MHFPPISGSRIQNNLLPVFKVPGDRAEEINRVEAYLRDLGGASGASTLTPEQANGVIDKLVADESKKPAKQRRSREFFSYEGCTTTYGNPYTREVSKPFVEPRKWAIKLYEQGYRA